jgi:DNA-binding transcriptional ArsR family regulator
LQYCDELKKMGLTKTGLFTEEQNQLAWAARVLGHPARIAILEQLLRTRTCINTELVQELGLAQATVSQHLRELKDLGLIEGTIEGTRMCYCIHAARWAELQGLFEHLFGRFVPPAGSSCC